ncbi:ABC transporter permease [Psychrobacillus glaciei]|uniref:ABC transporter permease n=1 Tax=Psychrobacillus glaciei TaxID=2283160 RepID=A0A5J6SWZ6_9BACI|nr:ABC transporter permease subunit [Psychrobacillus glaciei]QFG00898.1 ABC transporter permease [Psychrobacillus glaciei]
MLNLIRNEWLKLWSKKATWVMVVLVALLMIGFAGINKWINNQSESRVDWKQDSQEKITTSEGQLAIPNLTKDQKQQFKESIEVEKYRLEHNIAPIDLDEEKYFISDIPGMLSIITLFTVVVAAGIVASEFSQGTIKMLLTRPVKRWKILTSKLITVGIFAIVMTMVLFIVGVISGYIFFDSIGGKELELVNGQIVVVSFWGRLLLLTGLSLINVFVIGTLAFMIGSVFRSSSLAIGISIFLMFMGVNIVMILSRFEFVKYVLFANTNLSQYIGNNHPMIEGQTMLFSIAVILVYVIVFLVISYWSFTKRDVTA